MSTLALPTLDQIVATVAADEATYNGDLAAISNIEGNIETATSPLAAAEAKLATDKATYVEDLNTLLAVVNGLVAGLGTTSGS